MDTQPQFDELFRSVLLERKQPDKAMVFSFDHVVRGEEYPAAGAEKAFLAAYPRTELRTVYLRARIDAGQEEQGAVFVRLNRGGPTIIGFGAHGAR